MEVFPSTCGALKVQDKVEIAYVRGQCQKDVWSHCKGSTWPNLGQFEHQNRPKLADMFSVLQMTHALLAMTLQN